MKELLKKNEDKIILIIGFILIAAISFEAGLLRGKSSPEKPIIIEKALESSKIESPTAGSSEVAGNALSENTPTISPNTASSETAKNCAYVGSKNSNKYHLPSCRYAKLIKPENVVCFSSIEDATSKNYLPDKSCIK